ncbi:MAG: hypothetical protein JWN92_1629 [Candidatus Acidoferrum typicum]|nr:hypothetical protein [Candidatus Acidoferrum typicum]
MRTRLLLIALAAVTLWTLIGSSKANTVEAQVRVTDSVVVDRTQSYQSPWKKIDERAKLENPADGNSVRALVDEIFKYPHSLGEIPPVMDSIVKERLTQAEMNYKLGRGPGVEVNGIVRLVNKLAERFQLADSARTTAHQAEVLRFGLEMATPTFMALPSTSQVGKPVPTDSSVMSPVQATFLLLTLIDAKLLSPDYQLPPDEWEKTKYVPMMENLTKLKELKDSGRQSKPETKGVLISLSSQSEEIRTAVSHAISQMSLTDGLDLVDQAFAAVGIGK